MDKKLAESFRYWNVNDEWQGVLERYLIDGFSPGSFFEALLANDLVGAATRSHPSNQWKEIMAVMKWLINRAPKESYGSYEKVREWLRLSEDQRRTYCENANVQMSMWDHLNDKENV